MKKEGSEVVIHLDNSLIHVMTFDGIPPKMGESLGVAARAQKNALNGIFRRIAVGAALWVDKGGGELGFVEGFNIEHDMPQLATCAEQCALTVGIQSGYSGCCVGITVVAQRRQEPRHNLILPCDMCRPRLRQASVWSGAGDDFQVVVALPNYKRNRILHFSLGTLLEDPRLRYTPEGINIETLVEE